MAASGFFGAQRPRGGSIAAGEKSQKPPLQEGDRPSVRSATERPRGAAWGRHLGDDRQHLGLSKIGVIHGAQSRHVLQTHKRDRAADNRLPVRHPPAFISKDKQGYGKVVMRFDMGR
jgi:hypothetical protein